MKWEENPTSENWEGVDTGSGPGWTNIRQHYAQQADEFIHQMDELFGPRNLHKWGGSTIDSVIGAFLTQNVADHVSSNAFMYLEAKFPSKQTNNAEDVALIGHLEESLNLTHDYDSSNSTKSRKTDGTKKKKETRESEKIDWQKLKNEIYENQDITKATKVPDKVNWAAVLHAPHAVVAETIKCRGEQLHMATRIQDFLMLLKEKHGSFDLDWLQYLSPKNVQIFLQGILGIGPKSVGCIRLLSLGHSAFPVDVNVCRIAIRLGWVELESSHLDPEEDILLSVDKYLPLLRDVQRYLWPRLCTIDKDKLYKLHCGMITFGKVICRKKKTNCGACPFIAKCKYYKYREKVRSALAPTVVHQIEMDEKETSIDVYGSGDHVSSRELMCQEHIKRTERECMSNYEPIIEMPPSPEYGYNEMPPSPDYGYDEQDLPDIEDVPAYYQAKTEAYYQAETDRQPNKPVNTGKHIVLANAQEDVRELKAVFRLRTEHYAYVLPDGHEALKPTKKIAR